MAKGRGSASWSARAIVTLMVVSVLLLQADYVQAATYTVGDSGVWTYNAVGWPKGKNFRAGDVLVFNYNPRMHNVVKVDSGSYNNCQTPAGAKTYTSGNDRITLSKGQNFFICNFPGHCENAMKIAVTAV
ncbi:Phytocyanin domain [Arabidopsis thaliana x Arabidopsis arenosa]|uniref:Basic blue protein n=1 Tax=Arabidopsis thaliana x Arabidopsis arenosa TaxID=1240361 RepID=A0A8T1ZHA7_9BRAS|nr:Phytocyanin domain [Arabidopsis thaliana x Arabidopsis arenosa]